MKIVNRQEFLNLPEGVVYAKYEPHIFEDIQIKGQTLKGSNLENIDWFYTTLLEVKALHSFEAVKLLEKSLNDRTSFDLDFNVGQRDGCFEYDQLFVVYEKEDVLEMINKLSSVLNSYPEIL